MKKTVKKITALILTVLLIIPLVSVQGFALFDKITDVKITSVEKFSRKQIEEEFEWIEELGGADSDEYYQYILICEAEVTLSTGEVISTENGAGTSKDKKRNVLLYSYVDIRECKEAYEKGTNKVKVHTTVTLTSSIGITLDTKNVDVEKTFPDKLVKKLSLASGKLTAYDIDGMYLLADIEGTAFEITYGDGTKKKAKVKKNSGTVMIDSYTLDGQNIFADVDYEKSKSGKLYATVYFCDYEMRTSVNIKDFPIKSIKINKVTFDDDFNEKSLTYTITKTNGKTYKRTYEFGKAAVTTDILGMTTSIYPSDSFEDFDIVIAVISSEGDEYPVREIKDVEVSVESYISAVKTVEGPEQEATVLGELLFKIKKLIEKIFMSLPIVIV